MSRADFDPEEINQFMLGACHSARYALKEFSKAINAATADLKYRYLREFAEQAVLAEKKLMNRMVIIEGLGLTDKQEINTLLRMSDREFNSLINVVRAYPAPKLPKISYKDLFKTYGPRNRKERRTAKKA
jgi:hypothetical protein